jgi:hypothetical protein
MPAHEFVGHADGQRFLLIKYRLACFGVKRLNTGMESDGLGG